MTDVNQADAVTGLAPVVEDMSIYVLAGRVKPTPDVPRGYTYVGRLYDDAAEAERLGFRRVLLSERHGLKDSGAVLGGVAARTSRLEVGTGAISSSARHPLVVAGWGATMQALNGPRLNIGLGRGDPLWMGLFSYQAIGDFARILRRLWAGETVTYDGPAGRYDRIRVDDLLGDVPQPKLWYFALGGGPKAARAAADPVFDGVALYPFLTPEAVHAAVQRIRGECERIGRDPASLRIAHCITTAPELDDFETRALCHARLVTYLQWPGLGEPIAHANGWGDGVIHQLRDHDQLKSLKESGLPADQVFHRVELLEPAKLIPDTWIDEVCGIGSVDNCVKTIEKFRDAGTDETIIYGPTPAQNAKLIAAWRERNSGSR